MNIELAPILKGLTKYKHENVIRFHMPGHYGKNDFPELSYLCDNILSFDVTEVDGTDNLNDPKEMILESLEYIKSIYNTKKSYILVNGSTSGIHIAIDTLIDDNAHIITARNCHKSVHNILERKNTYIHYVYPEIDADFCIDSHIDSKTLFDMIHSAENKSIKIQAVILTYPNYFGRTFDLKEISEFLEAKNIYLIIDEAHGAHFPFHKNLPSSAISQGATIAIQSAHKTLPALTQCAMLHIGNNFPKDKIVKLEEKIKFFQTTSPSYILMASCETAVNIMDKYASSRLEMLLNWIENLKAKLSAFSEIKIYGSLNPNHNLQDFCKFGINTPIPGELFSKILREKYHIQAEMSIGYNVLFMFGISHKESDLIYLGDSIIDIIKNNKALFEDNFKLNLNTLYPKTENKKIYFLSKINNINNLRIIVKKIKDIDNDICAEQIIPYPPGIPLLMPYEIINDDIKKVLEYHKFSEIKCFSIC